MISDRVAQPDLLICALALRPPPAGQREALRGYLERIWARCEELGMTEPVEGFDAAFPEGILDDASGPGAAGSFVESTFRKLAARRLPGAGGVYEAYAFVRHDTAGIVVSLAPNQDDDVLARWTKLLEEWDPSAIGNPPPGLIGEAFVYTARVGDGGPLQAWDGAIRSTGVAHGFAPAPYLSEADLCVWGTSLEVPRRTLAVVAGQTAERSLDRLLWDAGEGTTPPLISYLTSTAKVRYELEVFDTVTREVRSGSSAVDDHLREILAILHSVVVRESRSIDPVLDAQKRLQEAQERSTELGLAITRLREMQRTVAIAMANMRARAPKPAPDWEPEDDTVFDRDDEWTRWLAAQIEHETIYGLAVRERAQDAQNLVDLHLRRATEQVVRARDRMSLLQTSLLAAVTAAITLGPVVKPAVPTSVFPAIVTAWAAASLAVPSLFIHWHDNRYRPVEVALAVLLGASLGWFGGAWTQQRLAAGLLAVAGAVVFPVVLIGVQRWARARRRRRSRV